MQETIKKTVVLEAYIQTSYDTYSHIFKTVEIEIPDDGNEWHVCGKIHLSRYKHGFPSLGRIPRFCDHCGQAIAENLEGMEDE